MNRKVVHKKLNRENVLWELAQSVGQSLEVRKNCQEFATTLVSLLGLHYAAIWMKDFSLAALDKITEEKKANRNRASLLFTGSKRLIKERAIQLNKPPFNGLKKNRVASLLPGDPHYSEFVSGRGNHRGAYVFVSFGNIGILEICAPIGSSIIQFCRQGQFQKIMDRFVVSIKNCLLHQSQKSKLRLLKSTMKHSPARDALFREFVEGTDDLVVRVDENGTIIYANRSVERIYGLPPEKMIGRCAFEFIYPDDKEKTQTALAGWIKDRIPSTAYENRVVSSAGEIHHLLWTVNLHFDTRGNLLGVNAIAREITDRKKWEGELSLSEDRYRSLFEATIEAIMIYDDGIILDVNSAFTESLGYEPGEIIGRSVMEVIAPESHQDIMQKMKLISGNPDIVLGPYEISGKKKDGSIFVAECRSKSGFYKKKRARIVAIRDITERKRAEEELRERERKLQRQNEVYLRVTKSDLWTRGDLFYAMRYITEAVAYSMEISGASVWLFSEDYSRLTCIDLFLRERNEHVCELELTEAEYPPFAASINENRIIAIDDVNQDQGMKEFVQGALHRLGIASIMTGPIRMGGKIAGIISFYMAGAVRKWTLEDQQFASSMADMVSLVLEDYERLKTKQKLEYRLAFDDLIAAISTNFISLPVGEVDKGLHDALRKIGEFAAVDRSYIFLISRDRLTASNTHEWCAEAIVSQKHMFQNIKIEDYSWWMEKLQRFDNIYIPRVAELPDGTENVKPILEMQGVKSLICVPLIYENTLIGLVGFDSVREEKIWSQDIISLLKIVGEMFANALEHKWAAEEIQRANDELERKVEERTRELREKQSQLVQSEKMASLGNLVAGVAHEINTPLGAMKSNNDVFIRSIVRIKNYLLDPDTPSEIRENGELLSLFDIVDKLNEVSKNAAERITAIVNSLRKFARLDKSDYDTVDIHEGIDNTLTLVHHELKNRVTVHKEYGSDLPAVKCFPNQLNQVFMNILVNASQAIDGNGDIFIRTLKEGNYFVIEFKDSGKGIPREHIHRIFDPGFTTKGAGVGTGLGLSIAYQIIQDHRGRIEVESEVVKGTTFRIYLPISPQ